MKFSLVFALVTLSLPAFALENALKCDSGKHWVRAFHRRAYTRGDGVHFSAANVSSHCADNPPGFEFWKDQLRTGRPPGWPIQNEKEKGWADLEKERVLEELGQLPGALRPASFGGIFRMAKSKDYPNPASSGRNVELSADEQKSYAEAAGWLVSHGALQHLTNRFVEEDGSIGPAEDFANNVDHFLYDPKKLWSISPGAFFWIKDHFGDNFRLGRGNSHG